VALAILIQPLFGCETGRTTVGFEPHFSEKKAGEKL
jgi:hypothetical protein